MPHQVAYIANETNSVSCDFFCRIGTIVANPNLLSSSLPSETSLGLAENQLGKHLRDEDNDYEEEDDMKHFKRVRLQVPAANYRKSGSASYRPRFLINGHTELCEQSKFKRWKVDTPSNGHPSKKVKMA